LVSGGHTLLVLVRGMRDYEILGRTLDDAVGEAYDKVGKLIGLEFPAGAALDALAANGDPAKFPLPTPKQDTAFDFSFSGLKTAVLYRRNALREDAGVRPEDIAASFQQAAVASLVYAVESALRLHQCRAISCAGGVAANSLLRARMEHLAQRFEIEFYVPALKYCADNAAMIGYLAAKLNALGVYENCDTVLPRWPLETLPKLLPALD
jgi:N6-L-threonylcarbamoyladenine synthase